MAIAMTIAHAASFDTGLSPEAARNLLATGAAPRAPAGSWLRLRDLERSMVQAATGAEIPLWTGVKSQATVTERRAALAALRAHGYHLVAMVRWPSDSWKNGVRPDQPLRRLPLDLREAFDRCRQLEATYGDLIDYWEIENEPDISFVEENPETYAAFLKACYLGFKAKPDGGLAEMAQQTGPATVQAGRLVPGGQQPASGNLRPEVNPSSVVRHTPSGVLNAAFALPPGPYFDSWVANDGLRYTDGFNYHYYGYAEDFTGVYRQFEAAVTTARPAADEAVFQTQFYPASTGWQARVLAGFADRGSAAKANHERLQARSLATEEPALHEQARWLVANGTTVRETAEGWAFTVSGPADGPLRPAMAELPLADGWSAPADATFAFEYRTEKPAEKPETGRRLGEDGEANLKPEVVQNASAADAGIKSAWRKNQAARISYPQPSGLPVARSRELPVFLTEYGYGLLDKEARNTAAGREAQRAWFAAVKKQIDELRIEGPMAFILRPYREAGKNEFGLLMESAPSDQRSAVGSEFRSQVSGLRSPVSKSLGDFAVSPALAELLKPAAAYAPRSWTVATPPPVSVVMDFVGGGNLQMSKSHRGYLLSADTGGGRLLVYNLGAAPVSGEVTLERTAWTFADGARAARLALAPAERREIPVTIQPVTTDRFGPQSATARFRPGAERQGEASGKRETESQEHAATPPVVVPPLPLQTPGAEFEVYLRTANGNLYQTWPRLQAREAWQWYAEPLVNFTPAFFGRAHLPVALAENQPSALVFFFRPEKYPATYLVRHAQVVEYIRQTEGR